MSPSDVFAWSGSQAFRLTASGLHEDTLRIVPNFHYQPEEMLRLTLPTLCITYADMDFQNAVGGEQENFPASQAYGLAYFDPPVEIRGEQEIERLTYIRGARRVIIGRQETVIEFPARNTLVIPRMRLDREKVAEANLIVPSVSIPIDEPLMIQVLQYADGRHVGGVQIEKRHPDFEPPKIDPVYDLWVRVINGMTMQPLAEAMVNIWHWDPKFITPYGTGGFRLDDQQWTRGDGSIHVQERPSGELEAFTVHLPGWRVVPHCLRPLAGQQVRWHMRAWPLTPDSIQYEWKKGDTLNQMAQLTGHAEEDILRLNGLSEASDLNSEMWITLPCYTTTYRPEPWDNLDRVGRAFGYEDAGGLADASGLGDLSEYDGSTDLGLPDWHFFYAREHDTLETIDETFGLPKGSAITVGRVFRPDPQVLFPGETVAVPTPSFAEALLKQRES